jgi:hypothetical protein
MAETVCETRQIFECSQFDRGKHIASLRTDAGRLALEKFELFGRS